MGHNTGIIRNSTCHAIKSKKGDKNQELIQSSTTPDPGYHRESDKNTIKHHQQEPRG